jgi:hypothetical protein
MILLRDFNETPADQWDQWAQKQREAQKNVAIPEQCNAVDCGTQNTKRLLACPCALEG